MAWLCIQLAYTAVFVLIHETIDIIFLATVSILLTTTDKKYHFMIFRINKFESFGL